MRPRLGLVAVALGGAVLAACLLTRPQDAGAHARSISHSTWTLDDDGADVEARFTTLDLTQLPLGAGPAEAAAR